MNERTFEIHTADSFYTPACESCCFVQRWAGYAAVGNAWLRISVAAAAFTDQGIRDLAEDHLDWSVTLCRGTHFVARGLSAVVSLGDVKQVRLDERQAVHRRKCCDSPIATTKPIMASYPQPKFSPAFD